LTHTKKNASFLFRFRTRNVNTILQDGCARVRKREREDLSVYVCVCVCVRERERERDREREREKEREKEREREVSCFEFSVKVWVIIYVRKAYARLCASTHSMESKFFVKLKYLIHWQIEYQRNVRPSCADWCLPF